MRTTTLMIMALLILILMGCGGGSSNIRSTTTTPVPHEPIEEVTATTTKPKEAKKKSSSSGTVIGYSTKSDYIVRISGHKNPEIIQFLRKLEDRCNCHEDLVFQRIKPTGTSDAFRLALSPDMGEHIVFQVMVDDPNGEGRIYLGDQDWPAITAYDATVNFVREVGVWRSGSYGGKGRGLFKIQEVIVE